MSAANPPPTRRLYLEEGAVEPTTATVLAARDGALALDRSPFYPGGGGQPADHGWLTDAAGEARAVVAIEADAAGVLWHRLDAPLPDGRLGARVTLAIDRARRRALGHYHTVLHVLNTIALRDHGGWITGAQIAPDYARIDFKLDGLTAALRADLEAKVNGILSEARPVTASWVEEADFRRRPDLLRTLEVQPPIAEGRVRVVAIAGFDEQACGGTHARHTGELGRFAIIRVENKGKINKRLYVRLDPVAAA